MEGGPKGKACYYALLERRGGRLLAWAGRTVIFVDPSKTSQMCPNCETMRKKTLDERWHSCECGCELDRDTASAKVILDLGHKQLSVGTRPTSATA